jgi:hypothetical protein
LEGERFDELSRALAQASRRSLFRGLAAMAGAAVAACTPSRQPSQPSTAAERSEQVGRRLSANFGDCDSEILSSCTSAVFDRARSRMDDCLARCRTLPQPREQGRACAACFEWIDLMVQKDVRQCHAQTCGEGRVCMGSRGDPPSLHAARPTPS